MAGLRLVGSFVFALTLITVTAYRLPASRDNVSSLQYTSIFGENSHFTLAKDATSFQKEYHNSRM